MLRRLSIVFTVLAAIFTISYASAATKDIIKMNTDIVIQKDMVANDVVAIGGSVTVYGRVENNVVAVGGSVKLKEKSYVGGEVVVVGGEVTKDPTATIGEKVTQIYMPSFIPSITDLLRGRWIVLWATISILALLGFLGLAVLFAALIPEHIGVSVRILERSFLAMFLWGLLWAVLIVPITVLLAISIIGIILIPVEIALVALAMILGYIVSAIFVGKKILSRFRKVRIPFAEVILGVLVLSMAGFVPFVGQFIKAIFLIAGFGAVLTTRFGTIK